MMDVSAVSTFDFSDKTALSDFLLTHGMAHETINQQLIIKGNYPINYPLFDIDESERGKVDWFQNHWLMHQSIADVLGITNLPALADVEATNPQEFADWLQLHQNQHIEIDQALSLT